MSTVASIRRSRASAPVGGRHDLDPSFLEHLRDEPSHADRVVDEHDPPGNSLLRSGHADGRNGAADDIEPRRLSARVKEAPRIQDEDDPSLAGDGRRRRSREAGQESPDRLDDHLFLADDGVDDEHERSPARPNDQHGRRGFRSRCLGRESENAVEAVDVQELPFDTDHLA